MSTGRTIIGRAPAEHRRWLLSRRRCGLCAEAVPARLVLRGGECPHCHNEVYAGCDLDPEQVMGRVVDRWRRWRWIVYALVAAGTLISSWIPFLDAAATFAAMVIVHIALVRRPVTWLNIGRKVTARMSLKLYLALLTFINLLIHALVVPLYGPHAAILTVTSVLLIVAYAEGSLRFVHSRLRREAAGSTMDVWEWLLPTALLGGLLAVSLAMVASVTMVAHALLWADIPGISDIASFLLDQGGE